MKCQLQKKKLPVSFHMFLQQFIYLMNETDIRNEIITKRSKFFGNNVEWLGSWDVCGNKFDLSFLSIPPCFHSSLKDKSVLNVLQKKMTLKKSKNCMFTICYHYEDRKVHYVSFIYDRENKRLQHFDPGISLYLHGQETLVPSIYKVFKTIGLVEKNQELGKCIHQTKWKGKIMGIQFDGGENLALPADAFCQTWTIFFLVRMMANGFESEDFIQKWCSIPPKRREAFLISSFILPILLEFPKFYKRVCNNIDIQDNFIQIMYDYIESCM